MKLFGDIGKGLEAYRASPGALLLDVREAEEYAAGHIPDAVSVPLSGIEQAALPEGKPLFLYCLRGTRSRRAAGILKKRGYRDVRSIGGIRGYRGSLERSGAGTEENPG